MSKTIKSIILVTISNIFTILAGILVGFVVPKVLGVLDYGYYKTFTLYLSYIGIFSLGIVDGIVLIYGDKDYGELGERKFRTFFRWYLLIHVFFTLLIISGSFLFLKGEYRIIFILYALDIVASNVTGYFQQISQITQRFKEYSLRNVIKSVLTSLSVLFIYLVYKFGWFSLDYKLYIYLTLIVNYTLTLWYVFSYKNLIVGEHDSLKDTFKEVIKLILTGFPLLFANLCSTLILTMDKQFVNVLFDIETFGKYAFAYNMLTLVTVATSAVSSVLYPILRRSSQKELKSKYSNIIASLLMFVFLGIALYYPLCIFIEYFLPNYLDSLLILRIIFPGLAISSCVTVVMHNYYKSTGDNLKYFHKSLIILFIAFLTDLLAYYLFKSTITISMGSIIVMLIWYVFVEYDLKKKFNIKNAKNFIYLIINVAMFYLISEIDIYYLGFIIQICAYALVTFLFYKNEIRKYIDFRKKRKKVKDKEKL